MSNDLVPDLFGLIEKTSYTGSFADVSHLDVAAVCAAFAWPDALGTAKVITRASDNSFLLSTSLDAIGLVMI